MDWSNEEYVRLYTRETADDLELSWEAVALWRAMLTKFDRAGLIQARNGWRSIAVLTRIPMDVADRAGSELIADGRVHAIDGGFYAPNFTEAQTTSKSDKSRQRESRDRRRSEADLQVIDITQVGHDVSHVVTSGHERSQNVTLPLLCSALPPVAEPPLDKTWSGKPDETPVRKRRSRIGPTCNPSSTEIASANTILAKLGEHANIKYSGAGAHIDLIVARLRDGLTEHDLRCVTYYCAHPTGKNWATDPKYSQYLRPETLFGPQTIARYLDAARSWAAKNRLLDGEGVRA